MVRKELVYAFFALLIALSGTAGAFGVVSDYNKNRPLMLSPGETVLVKYRIQNILGGEDITIHSEVEKGSDIARIVSGSEKFIPFGTIEEVLTEITIPPNTPSGQYTVTTGFSIVDLKESQGIVLDTGQDYSFYVIVRGLGKKGLPFSIFLTILSLLIVIIVLAVVLVTLLLKIRRV